LENGRVTNRLDEAIIRPTTPLSILIERGVVGLLI
jgi:hypothetical protein